MRLLSVFFTAATITLVGVAALGGTAVAQEEPTAQASAECPGAEVLETVGPTEDDLLIGPFPITGESLRLTYETTDADASGLPFFDVTVLDEAGSEVGGQVIFEEGVVREVVRAGPGRFTIEARSEDLKYTLTIEDCTGDDPGPPNPPPGGNNGPVPTNPAPDDQYNNDVDDPNDVVDNTESDEPLPNTGGVPLLGLAAFGLICVFAAFALFRPATRRDS